MLPFDVCSLKRETTAAAERRRQRGEGSSGAKAAAERALTISAEDYGTQGLFFPCWLSPLRLVPLTSRSRSTDNAGFLFHLGLGANAHAPSIRRKMDSEKTVSDERLEGVEVQDDAVYAHHVHDAALEWKAAQRRAGHNAYMKMSLRSTAKDISTGLKAVTKNDMALGDFYEKVLVGVDPRERVATLLLLESLHVWRGDAVENVPVLDVTHAAVLASVLLNVMDKQRLSVMGKYDYLFIL